MICHEEQISSLSYALCTKLKKELNWTGCFPVIQRIKVKIHMITDTWKALYTAAQANILRLLLRETGLKKTKIPNTRTKVLCFANQGNYGPILSEARRCPERQIKNKGWHLWIKFQTPETWMFQTLRNLAQASSGHFVLCLTDHSKKRRLKLKNFQDS